MVGAKAPFLTPSFLTKHHGRLRACRRGRRRTAGLLVASVAALAIAVALLLASAGGRPRSYYVAIGASQALGFQPMSPGVQRPTDEGYANDLVSMEKARWPDLTLVRFACPGIRVEMALSGGRARTAPARLAHEAMGPTSGRCRRRAGSEVGAASEFIRSHTGQVALVTVDLGFPDVTACIRKRVVDAACLTDALARVRSALPAVVSRLRAAGGSSLRIVGLSHDDPFLGYYLGKSDPDPSFAEASVRAIGRLNRVIRAAYGGVGVRVARVSRSFATGVATPADLRGWGTVPLDVKRICTLTWVCTDRNPHPNAKGYDRIASTVAATLGAS